MRKKQNVAAPFIDQNWGNCLLFCSSERQTSRNHLPYAQIQKSWEKSEKRNKKSRFQTGINNTCRYQTTLARCPEGPCHAMSLPSHANPSQTKPRQTAFLALPRPAWPRHARPSLVPCQALKWRHFCGEHNKNILSIYQKTSTSIGLLGKTGYFFRNFWKFSIFVLRSAEKIVQNLFDWRNI